MGGILFIKGKKGPHIYQKEVKTRHKSLRTVSISLLFCTSNAPWEPEQVCNLQVPDISISLVSAFHPFAIIMLQAYLVLLTFIFLH